MKAIFSFIMFSVTILSCNSNEANSDKPTLTIDSLAKKIEWEGVWVNNQRFDKTFGITRLNNDSFKVYINDGSLFDESFTYATGYYDHVNNRLVIKADSVESFIYPGTKSTELTSSLWGSFSLWSTSQSEEDSLFLESWSLSAPGYEPDDVFSFDMLLKKNNIGAFLIGEGIDMYFSYSIKGDSLLLSRQSGFDESDFKQLYGIFNKRKDSLQLWWPESIYESEGSKAKPTLAPRTLVKNKDFPMN